MTWCDRLVATLAERDSNVCVGLDPTIDDLPEGFKPDPDDILRFVTGIIEATSEFAAAYKPNSAFYEVLGPPGMEVLQAVIAAVPVGIPVILDAKRGDLAYTATRYAQAAFETYKASAVTVNPYLGKDSVEPFTAYHDCGTFLVCRTSNPGAKDYQDIGTGHLPLYLEVARRAREWDLHGNIGLVTGATWPEDIEAVREVAPHVPLLIPGIGAQGGNLRDCVRAARGPDAEQPFLISASRSIAGASRGADFQHAAAQAAHELREEIREIRVSTPLPAD